MDIFSIISLLGGLAMFLFGMKYMGEKLEKLAGGRLEKMFEKLTSNRFLGLALGAFVTAVVQSSSATTVMLVGFVNSGLMRLAQTIPVIMGANIGTTITTWLLSLVGIEGDSIFIKLLKPTSFSPIIALIGVILIMCAKSGKKRDVGGILIGFAILMFGMTTMGDAVEPLSTNEQFAEIFVMFSNPFFGVLAGAILTAIIQSSAASIGMLQMLSLKGMVTFGSALPIILGQNIGTCITAILSSIGANKNAKRVAVVHLVFNVIGTVLFLVVFYTLDAFIHFSFVDESVTTFNIALVHTIFNLSTTLVLIPFTNLLEKLAYKIIRDKEDETEKIQLLDERLLSTPGVAIEHCRNLTIKMGQLSEETIKMALELLSDDEYDEEKEKLVITNEGIIDSYEDKLGTYLVKLSSRSTTVHDGNTVSMLLHAIGDFERISDHAVNLITTATELREKNIVFSDKAVEELKVLYSAVSDILEMTVKAFETENLHLAEKVEPLEEVIDGMRIELKARHVARLQKNQCTLELGFIFSDLLTNLERVADHCSNIAVCMIQLKTNSLENHEYLNMIRQSDEYFQKKFKTNSEKYALPSAE
ncbi:MAG: Na/Pi cotransporter family protein [Oscillospiraceae bacterium]|nr:Na/Pi cotransporter family protein [Oscillospiraceae bacterium]